MKLINMKLINKDELLAEIERRLEAIANASTLSNKELAAIQGAQQYELINLVQYLDTLEVKEVDLNEEIEKCLKRHNMLAVGRKDFTDIAKTFFELGMQVSNKAQK